MTMHRVQDGEKLSEIARAYGISTDQLVAANPTKEAVTLVSGEQVFASLAAGEDIELPPGVLGAAESDYPRRFYEQAFDALHDTLSLDLKSQDALDKVAQAAAYMKSAVTYLETHPLMSSKYRDQQDAVVYAKGIALSIDTLDNILTGQAMFHEPSNYYALLADTLKRLGDEMDKWPKPSAASGPKFDFVFRGNPFDKPATAPFPTGSPTGGAPVATGPKYGSGAGAGSTPKTTDDAEAACAAKGTRLNRTTGMCVANDGTTSKPFPDVTWGGPANVKIPSDTEAPAATAASCAAKGMMFDVTTKACKPVPEMGSAGPQGGKTLAENQTSKASVSTTKKVLIVAGSVVALGLAGWGAWHVLAKDKDAEKKPTP